MRLASGSCFALDRHREGHPDRMLARIERTLRPLLREILGDIGGLGVNRQFEPHPLPQRLANLPPYRLRQRLVPQHPPADQAPPPALVRGVTVNQAELPHQPIDDAEWQDINASNWNGRLDLLPCFIA